jgi:hypothetical protein
MFRGFFGLHQQVLRSGLWASLRPGEKDLYVYLMEESERFCTLVLKRTDAEIQAAVGTASRTLCNARKRLQERGLIGYRSGDGNKYQYTICDPATGKPYPGAQRLPFSHAKKRNDETLQIHTTQRYTIQPDVSADRKPKERLEDHGLPNVFSD